MKRVAKFNSEQREDYSLWSIRFEAPPESKELLDVVLKDSTVASTPGELTVEEKIKRAKARSVFVQGLGGKPFCTVIAKTDDPSKMYAELNARYTTGIAATRVQLQTDLHCMQYNSSKPISEYVDAME